MSDVAWPKFIVAWSCWTNASSIGFSVKALGVDVGVGVGVANDVQVVLKSAVMRTMSKMSTKPSGGSGAISYRAGAGGTD